MPELGKRAPSVPGLSGHLGQTVRSQKDDGDHGDHEKLGWVEVEHVTSL
jgi:hypothetical protein